MPKFVTIGIYDSRTENRIYQVQNVPITAIFEDNFKDCLYDRFGMVTGITPRNYHKERIDEFYDVKRPSLNN